MLIDRRRIFLASGALGLGFLNACRSVAGPGATHFLASVTDDNRVVRRKWQEGAKNEWQTKYIAAVTWFKANDGQTFDSADPRSYLSWEKLIEIHNLSCTHGSQNLLPWHRLYLAYFEAACQLALNDRSFALPYWDWSESRAIPKDFYEVDILKADRDLAKGESLAEEVCGPAVVDKLLALDDFGSLHGLLRKTAPWFKAGKTHFGGQFEAGPHNGIHNGVGGIMADPLLSPTDPIFWLHHSNIDRIWALWQQRHAAIATNSMEPPFVAGTTVKAEIEAGAVLADDKRWTTTTCRLIRSETEDEVASTAVPILSSANNHEGVVSMVNADLVDFGVLGYSYDSQPKALGNSRVVVKPVERVFKNFEGRSGAIENGVLRTEFSALTSGYEDLLRLFAKNLKSRVVISAGKLPFPTRIDLRKQLILRFFVTSNDTPLSLNDMISAAAFKRPEYVGFHSFFTLGHHASTDDMNSIAMEFDASAVVQEIVKRGVPKTISVLAVPFNLKTGKLESGFLKGSSAEVILTFGFAS